MRMSSVSALLLAWLFVCSPLAHADNANAQRVAAELSNSPVYIDPLIDDAAADTALILSRLTDKDEIVVVILPDNTAVKPDQFAQEIAQNLPVPRTIALVVGTTSIVQAAAWPPQTVASDLMRRSANVARDPTDRMVTFIRTVHTWQENNPRPVPPSPPKEPTDYGEVFAIGGGSILVIAALTGAAWTLSRRNARRQELYGAPRRYRRALKTILRYRDSLGARSKIGQDLTMICQGAVRYFRGNSSEDAAILHLHLKKLAQVLQGYSDIRRQPNDYSNADELMCEGESSIHEFRQFVNDVVRKGAVVKTGDFTLNTASLRDARNSTNL